MAFNIPVFVNDGVEGETVAPTGCEVADVNVVVARRLHLAPEQQRVLGWPRSLVLLRDHRNILDLEPEAINQWNNQSIITEPEAINQWINQS